MLEDMLFTGDGEAFNVGLPKSNLGRMSFDTIHRSDNFSKRYHRMRGQIWVLACA